MNYSKEEIELNNVNSLIEELETRRGLILKRINNTKSLTNKVSHGSWIIKKSENKYYQYYRYLGDGHAMTRKGVNTTVSLKDFENDFRLATPSEEKQHLAFLGAKANIVKTHEFNTKKCDFYLITVTGQYGTKKRHTTYDEAEKEAIRLCKQENHEAFILGVVASVKPIQTITHEIKQR